MKKKKKKKKNRNRKPNVKNSEIATKITVRTCSKSVEYNELISCSDEANGFIVLSEKTRKYNHLADVITKYS